MQLQETIPFEYTIVEGRGKSKRPGVLMTLEGIFQRADTKNANGRVYPKSLWDGIFSSDEVNERITARRMLGELDHPSCLTDDNFRVLTLSGWKRFREVTTDDKVWSIKDGEIVVSKVDGIVDSPYDGPTYQFSGRNIESEFTPNHRFLIIKRPDRNNKETYTTAAEIAANPGKFAHSVIPKAIDWPDREEPPYFVVPGLEYSGHTNKDISDDLLFDPETFASFLGIYLAEGGCSPETSDSVYTIKIYQKNEWSKKFIWDEILCNFHEDLVWRETDDGFALTDKRLWTYLHKLGNKYTKYIPQEVKNLPAECLEQLVFWFGIGDGRMVNCDAKSRVVAEDQTVKEAWIDQFRNERYVPYTRKDVFSVSEKLVRDLHECVVKFGGSGSISEILPNSDYTFAGRTVKAENKVPLFQLHISHTKNIYLDPRFLGITESRHKGNVFCLKVTHGNFYMEQYGKSFWTGNSGSTALSRVAHVITEHGMGSSGEIKGSMDILDTPMGQIAATLFEAGCQLGISSRGDGSVEKKGDIDEVQNDFRLETYDLVLKPSTPGAYPQVVEGQEEGNNNDLIASAVEGLVKSTSNVDVLLECHKIISALEGCESRCGSILEELKSKLGRESTEPPETNNRDHLEEQNMTVNQVPESAPPGINLSPEMRDFLQEWVNKGVAEAVASKDDEIAKLNERIVAVTGERDELGTKLEAAESLIDEFTRKVREMGEAATTDDELQERYDASVKLLDEAITRLKEMADVQRRADAAESLLNACLERFKSDAVEGATEALIDAAEMDDEVAEKYRGFMSACESVDEVFAKFEEINSLVEQATPDTKETVEEETKVEPPVREPLPPKPSSEINEDKLQQQRKGGHKEFVTDAILRRVGV